MYFININKPKGLTSFDIVRILRKKLNTRQIGHSGTLDPLASGVLQVAVGKATKLLDYLDSDKTYVADIIFGYRTETYDSESDKIFVKKPNFSKEDLINSLNQFLGKTMQTPPIYSAVKLNGRKICDIIRDNPDFEHKIQPKEIEIYSISLLEFNKNTAKIEVKCKRGTYIRSLINDLGNNLGCGAYMSDLIRTKAGNFKIETSNNIDMDNYTRISPIDALSLQRYELNQQEYKIILNGNFIKIDDSYTNGAIMLTKDNKLVSIANLSDNLVKPKKVFKED